MIETSLLVPIDENCYEGFVSHNMENYRIRMIKNVDTKEILICAEDRLKDILKGTSLLSRISSLSCFSQVYKEIVNTLSHLPQNVASSITSSTSTNSAFYESFISEMDKIGWESLTYISPSLHILKLRYIDNCGREHICSIERLPVLKVEAQLPNTLSITKRATLHSIFIAFKESVNSFSSFFTVMDDIDANLWVLDPDKPLRSDMVRRVAISRQASLQFEVNPSDPFNLIDFRFFGNSLLTQPLRQSLANNINKWITDGSVLPRENIEKVFEIHLPSKKSANREEISGDCDICYSYKLDDAIPSRVCENQKCGKIFHSLCLYEWLYALPTSRKTFDMVYGTCPFCTTKISCSFKCV